jgi:hypothetical protein
VYVYDSETLELICKLANFTEGLKYAKVSFYTLKKLIVGPYHPADVGW